LGTGSMRQQDGQGSICQDVSGCPAEYHLSQSVLRVGALDQKIAAAFLRHKFNLALIWPGDDPNVTPLAIKEPVAMFPVSWRPSA